VLSGEPLQFSNHNVHVITNGGITADQVGVGVDENAVTVSKKAPVVKVKENGAAAQKGLEITFVLQRIEAPEYWQQLALATRPFEKRPHCGARSCAAFSQGCMR
jgi:hypothetical protein